MLCSPFAYRTYQKPLGYAGDYEMVNMLLRNPQEGSSVFAKVLNVWFLAQPPAQAHRNRIQYLTQKLMEESARLRPQGRVAKISTAEPVGSATFFEGRLAGVAEGKVRVELKGKEARVVELPLEAIRKAQLVVEF